MRCILDSLFIFFSLLSIYFPSTTFQAPIHGSEHVWDARTYFTISQFETLKGIAFQRFLECYKTPNLALQEVLVEEPDDPSIKTKYGKGLSFEAWSPFIQDFNFYNELQLDDDPAIMEYHIELYGDPHFEAVRFGLPIWFAIIFIIYSMHTFYYFWMGAILGAALMWVLPRIRPPLHDLGRLFFINYELTKRERIRYNDREAYNEIYRHYFYRVPYFFREHSSESEPEVIRNLLDPYERYVESFEDVLQLTKLSVTDLDFEDYEIAALALVDENGRHRKYSKPPQEALEVGVAYINEIQDRDPRRNQKNYKDHQERLDADVAKELGRLKGEVTDFRKEEKRKGVKGPRPKRPAGNADITDSSIGTDKIERRGGAVDKTVPKLPDKATKKKVSISAVPRQKSSPTKVKLKWKQAKNKVVKENRKARRKK